MVLNGWSHSVELLQRLAASALPPGPTALLYGDDSLWSASELEAIRSALAAVGRPLEHHFAINLDAEAVRLPHAANVPIGLDHSSAAFPEVLKGSGHTQPPSARAGGLLCCCHKPWPEERKRAFALLRVTGHSQCNLSAHLSYPELLRSYTQHRFVASVRGHGQANFREWEALVAGAIPLVYHFEEQDELLSGLPVVRVRSWASATPAFLEADARRIEREAARGAVSWTKVNFPYWLHSSLPTWCLKPSALSCRSPVLLLLLLQTCGTFRSREPRCERRHSLRSCSLRRMQALHVAAMLSTQAHGLAHSASTSMAGTCAWCRQAQLDCQIASRFFDGLLPLADCLAHRPQLWAVPKSGSAACTRHVR